MMKADSCGTFSEQQRFYAGWRNATREEKMVYQQCANCCHVETKEGKKTSYHCNKMDCATGANKICEWFGFKW
jgi:hypothetical protein